MPQNSKSGTGAVVVCQRGARRRYAVPRMLEQAGMLAALYTDSNAFSLAGRMALRLKRRGVAMRPLDALSSRVPSGIPRHKVRSFDRTLLCGRSVSAVYSKWGLQGANVIYSMYGEEAGFLKWAKSQGARIIVDVFIHPATNRIVAAESARLIGGFTADTELMAREDGHSRRTFEVADILLCPSEWVAEGVHEFFPECAGRVRVVPYGSSIEPMDSINESPTVGRVLFAGREPLRKGVHYLAEATRMVREKGGQVDVRLAGVTAAELGWVEHREEFNCIGTLPLDQMRGELRRADLLVLPSLSEGQAGVVVEAMACGCPVIATRESGVDFKPGCGITVPARDAAALADAILGVVKNRERRRRLAEGALAQSGEFSMAKWRQRLVEVVEEAIAL